MAPSAGPVRNFRELQKTLSPHFLSEDPQGWNRQLERAVSSSFLDGNNGGANRVTFADGSQVVTKNFLLSRSRIDEARQIINQMKDWETKGEGAALRGVSVSENPRTGEIDFKVVMEDVTAPQNSVGHTVSAGMGNQLHSLRGYSKESRSWVANRMVELLDKHPDPHGKNAFFRVTQLSQFGHLPPEGSYYQEGDLVFQVLLIDATGSEGSPSHPLRSGDPKTAPPLLLQYNRQNQSLYFKKQLNLP